MLAPAGVLAPYLRQDQPRQARTAGERLADKMKLAARQDDMLAGLDKLNDAGALRAGSQLDRLLREELKNTTTLVQLAELGQALPALASSPVFPAGPGQALRDSRATAGQDARQAHAARDAHRAELRALAASTGYFTSELAPAIPAHPGPDGPQPGDEVDARQVRRAATAATRNCRRCLRLPALFAAEHADPSPALLAGIRGDTANLSALCPGCLTVLQAAHPGTWTITPLEAP